MKSLPSFLVTVRDLIAKNELSEAIQLLQNLLKDSPKLEEALLQSARLQDIRKQIRLGIISFEEANLSKNQIRTALMDFLAEIEEQVTSTELQQELSNAPTAQRLYHQHAEKIINIENVGTANF